MAYELVYTSAPEGVTRGSSGFCVAACTKGLGPRLIVTLESLSAYKPLYPHYAPNAWENPVSRSHYLYEVNGEQQHILSRICFNGVDHTGRSNKLASHLVLNERETAIAQGGPSSLLLREELFKDASWPIKAEYFMKQKEIPATAVQVRKCSGWETVMGDAGWGGYLAQTFIDSPNRNVYIAYDPVQNKEILPLFHEAISLLPEELRWKLTFNTYFVNLPVGMSCRWRGCPVDSDAIRTARRSPMNIIIDLTRPQLLEQESPLITTARTGLVRKIEAAVPPPDPEVGRAGNGNFAGEPVKRPPELDFTQKTMQNSGHPFRLSGPETPADFKKPPAADKNSINGDVVGGFSSRKKLFLTVAFILCILFVAIGGIVYSVAAAKKIRTYHEKPDDNKFQTDTVVEKINGKTENHTENTGKITKTPKPESESSAPHHENAIDRPKEKAADNGKNDIPGLPQEKTLSATPENPPSAKPQDEKAVKKASKKNTDKAGDDPRYLWTKSSDFHKKGRIGIKLGKIDTDRISIFLLPEMSARTVGTRLECADSNDRKVIIKTDFDKKHGILSFVSDGIYTPPEDVELLIRLRLAGEKKDLPVKDLPVKDLPVYFRLDISKIKPVRKHPGNLKLEIAEKIKLSIKASSMQIPKIYYKANNTQCRPAPVLRLVCGNGRRFDLVRNGDLFVYEGAGPVHKQLALLKELSAVRKTIENDLDEYARKLDAYAEKQVQQESNREEKAIELSQFVNNEKYRLEIARLLDFKKKTVPSARVLRKEIGSDGDKIQKLKDKELYVWVEKYDLLIKKLTTEIPLKELGFNSRYEYTYGKTRKETEAELEKIKSELEKQIRTSTVVLSCPDQEYEQFGMKEIQP